jgi:hypothetical protein
MGGMGRTTGVAVVGAAEDGDIEEDVVEGELGGKFDVWDRSSEYGMGTRAGV